MDAMLTKFREKCFDSWGEEAGTLYRHDAAKQLGRQGSLRGARESY